MYNVYCKMLPLTTLKLFAHYYSLYYIYILYYHTRHSFTSSFFNKITSDRQQYIVYALVRIWNSLEIDIRKSKYLKLFLKIIKTIFYHKSNKYNFFAVLDTCISKAIIVAFKDY